MHLFTVVLQELIEHLKEEIGLQETVKLIKKIASSSKWDIKITESGVIKSHRSITNEDTYLHVFSAIRNELNMKIGCNKTTILFKEASTQVMDLV